jgi:hypothetical protein
MERWRKKVSLFSAVTADEMQAARIVTGATMALFVLTAVAPGLRQHAAKVRLLLLILYLLACAVFVGYVLMR